jgi:hypothetical protein
MRFRIRLEENGWWPLLAVLIVCAHLDGQDLTGLPLLARKRQLDELHLVGPACITNGWLQREGINRTPLDGSSHERSGPRRTVEIDSPVLTMFLVLGKKGKR